METPTVKIKDEANKRLGYRIINADEFDAKKHTLADGEKKPETGGSASGGTDGASDGQGQPSTSSGDAAKPVAEVLAMFDNGDVPFMTAKAEAKKILGDDTPGKKAEIIDALKAKLDPQDEEASNGLTRREIEADLESAGVEFDPRDSVEDLAALREKAKG